MISSFTGAFRYLSNFGFEHMVYAGRTYLNSEAAYQAAKYDFPGNTQAQGELIARLMTATGGEAKKIGNANKDLVRPDWKQVNLGIMCEIVHAKFTQNKDIRLQLVNTGEQELVEGNYWHDLFWGSCRCDTHDDEGENWLGRILMAERAYWVALMSNQRIKEGVDPA